jgi:two-component system chemotaxis sensor kinase CheA
MSATMGYQAVAEFAHELESLVDRMRGEGRRATPTVTDALFAAADALEAGVAEASEAAARTPAMETALARLTVAFADADAGEILIRPRSSGAHRARATTELAAFAVAAGSDATPATGTPSNAPAPGAESEHDPFLGPGVIIRIRQAATTQLPGVRAFMLFKALGAIGEVAAMSPALDVLQAAAAPAAFAVRLVTQASEQEIEAAVRGVGDIDTVQVDMQGRARRRAPVEESVTEPTSLRARQVRIDLARLDTLMNLAGELTIARGRLLQLTAGNPDAALDETVQQLAALVGELQREVTASRMVPVGQVFDRFPRMVRDVARTLGKDVAFTIEGREIELDRSLIDELGEPVVHLLRNAVDHGLEGAAERVAAGKPAQGTLVLSAVRDRAAALVRVSDDGRGIDRQRVLERARAAGLVAPHVRALDDADLLRCIAHPGFSTKDAVTGVSGRGVGVDAVVTNVRALGGTVELHTEAGAGTTITLRLPLTLAIVRALLARAGGEQYALPVTHVRETLAWGPDVVRQVNGREMLVLRDQTMPLLDLRDVVRLEAPRVEGAGREIVVIERGERQAGLVVDQLVGQDDIVVKPFDAARDALGCFSGATILPDGAPALIMDLGSLL